PRPDAPTRSILAPCVPRHRRRARAESTANPGRGAPRCAQTGDGRARSGGCRPPPLGDQPQRREDLPSLVRAGLILVDRLPHPDEHVDAVVAVSEVVPPGADPLEAERPPLLAVRVPGA